MMARAMWRVRVQLGRLYCWLLLFLWCWFPQAAQARGPRDIHVVD